MSARFAAQLEEGSVRNILMIEIDHPEGMGYFWNGVGVLDYGGHAYQGFGDVAAVSELRSSTEIEIVERRFVCSGVDDTFLAGLDDTVKGRPALIYDALLDENYRVIERELIDTSELDYQVYSVSEEGKASIALVAHGGLFWLRRRSSAKWAPQEARAIYPDETGFDEIYLQEDLQDQWKP